jgi:hypothetical protein
MNTTCASQFKWSHKHGVAHASKLFDHGYRTPDVLYIKSPLTGTVKKFELNKQEAIDNESWDGELVTLRSNNGCSITIWNH